MSVDFIRGHEGFGLVGGIDLSIVFVLSILFVILIGFLIMFHIKRKISGRETLYFIIVAVAIKFHIILDIYSHILGLKTSSLILLNLIVTSLLFPVSLIFMYPMRKKLNKIGIFFYFTFLIGCIISDLLLNSYHYVILESIHSTSMLGLCLSFYLLSIKFLIDTLDEK